MRRRQVARQIAACVPDFDPDELAALVKMRLVVCIENHIFGQLWKAAINIPNDAPPEG